MFKKVFKIFYVSKIGQRLLVRVIMFSSVITLVFSGGQLYFEYKHDANKIEQIKKLIDDSYLKSIETAVWNINEEQAMSLLEGIVALPSVTKASIINNDGSSYTFQDKKQKGDISFSKELDMLNKKTNRIIGILTVEQSTAELYQNLQNRIVLVLFLNFIKTFLVAIFLLFIFHSMVTKHLIKINNFISHLDLSKTNSKLILESRANIKPDNKDEFDHFVDTFNTMSTELHSAWKSLAQSEKRYRLLVNGSLQGILVLSTDWQFIFANRQCLNIFRVFDDKEKIDNVKDYFPDETIKKVTNFFLGKKDASLYFDDVILNLGNGNERIIQTIFIQTTHENSPVLQIVMYDSTQLKEMKKKQQDYEIQLIQNNKMASVGTMLSGVTHEINNPNHMIKQNSIILADTWSSLAPKLQEIEKNNPETYFNNLLLSDILSIVPMLIEDIRQGSENINHIVDDLKLFVRQDQNNDVVKINVNDILNDTAHLLRISIDKRCNNFQLILADHLPSIWAYPQRLSQVFINLIVNALEALESTSQHITIKTFSSEDGSTIFISVKDEGSGMSKETQDKIFDVFFTTKLDVGGTGLGLSISQSIISQHHGEITIHSKINKGTEFIIALSTSKKPMNSPLGL